MSFAHETEQGQILLNTVRRDLEDSAGYLKGDIKPTNHITRLVQALRRGESAVFLLVAVMDSC
jgi:hypothetical protein